MEDSVFRNVGIYNSDSGELPKRKHTTKGALPGFVSCASRMEIGFVKLLERIKTWELLRATNTHSQYVMHIAFPLLQWLQERTPLLYYTRTYNACLIDSRKNWTRCQKCILVVKCSLIISDFNQWRTQEFCSGGSTNSVEDRGQRERGSGDGSPLVRGSGGSCNLVQEI